MTLKSPLDILPSDFFRRDKCDKTHLIGQGKLEVYAIKSSLTASCEVGYNIIIETKWRSQESGLLHAKTQKKDFPVLSL